MRSFVEICDGDRLDWTARVLGPRHLHGIEQPGTVDPHSAVGWKLRLWPEIGLIAGVQRSNLWFLRISMKLKCN